MGQLRAGRASGHWSEKISVRRVGEPSDIARGVRFFASPHAGWVSGQVLSIDGGHSLF